MEEMHRLWFSVLRSVDSFDVEKVFIHAPSKQGVGLAVYNEATLPALVGIDLQASGEYGQMIAREIAVLGPLALTALCLLFMFCSRRVVYPWLISIFSLVLPILILITNIFPA